jgi:hypothetical protein
MKKYLLLFLVPFSLLGQTVSERNKIVGTYDQSLIQRTKAEAALYYKEQQKRISDYVAAHPYVKSEHRSLQRIEDDGTPIFYTVYNQGSSRTISTNKMYPGGTLGLSVTGAGMTAGVWDGGKVRNTHVEFPNSRVTLSDAAATLSDHSTHVTGTVIASGVSAVKKGIAYGGSAKTYDWDTDYAEMLDFGSQGYLVSNHSYGYIAADLLLYKFGSYDSSSMEDDNVAVANPYYQVVKAAGNDRDDFTLDQVNTKAGYDLLTGSACAKNTIVVAAVNEVLTYVDEGSVVMSSFSNYGPTDDGRIKPDIAAKGVAVNSCISTANNAYAVFQGTSMAAPAITGMILLLQKHYNNLNASTYMRASTVRGLICHTAKEAGNYPGPDYEFGWGLADAAAAANVITNRNVSTVLEENTLAIGTTFTKQIILDSPQKLMATLCWTDPTGSSNGTNVDSRVPRLRNNLDLKILKDGVTYYPWKMDPDIPDMGATNDSDNNVDNVERVEIADAPAGVYTIQVTHKGNTLTGGSQVFSLIANGSTGLNLNTSDYDYDNSVFVYPNPAANVLNFSVKNALELSAVAIRDVAGKEVYATSKGLAQNQIDISSLSSGVYFVTFTSGTASVTKKFIKE